jgi:hypothetical protein
MAPQDTELATDVNGTTTTFMTSIGVEIVRDADRHRMPIEPRDLTADQGVIGRGISCPAAVRGNALCHGTVLESSVAIPSFERPRRRDLAFPTGAYSSSECA